MQLLSRRDNINVTKYGPFHPKKRRTEMFTIVLLCRGTQQLHYIIVQYMSIKCRHTLTVPSV